MTLPSYDLELKAADERRRLHTSVLELRAALRESLDINRNTRKHLPIACALVAVLGVGLGYSVTGIFTSH